MLTHQVITATAVTLFCLNGLWLLQSHRGWKRQTNLSLHVWSGHQAYGSSSNPSRGRTCFATLSDRNHTFTQHKEVAVRSDREPSVHSCKNLQSMMKVLQSWTINQTVLLKWLFICWGQEQVLWCKSKTKLLVEIWFLECNVQQHIITEKHGGSQAPCGVPNQPWRHLRLPQMERSCSWSLSQLQFGTWRSGYRSFHWRWLDQRL